VKLRAGNYQNQKLAYRRVCPPWLLDSGNPCRNDDISCLVGLVYNVDIWRLGTRKSGINRHTGVDAGIQAMDGNKHIGCKNV